MRDIIVERPLCVKNQKETDNLFFRFEISFLLIQFKNQTKKIEYLKENFC